MVRSCTSCEERSRAHKFSQRAAGLAAAHIHLKEPVLGVNVTLQEVQVMFILGHDVGDAIVFSDDPCGFCQTGKLN